MSGHNKWSKIKHQKESTDANRGNLFTKLTREIIVAVRNGGANPESNFKLRLAIQRARDSSMPNDNIERAIKRGSGPLEGAIMVEMTIEGYGPGGAAVLVQAVSDNRNRTLQDVRNIFSRNGGNLGDAGSVSWLFEPKGLIVVKVNGKDPDELALEALDAGADDVKEEEDGSIEVYTKPDNLEALKKALESKQLVVESAQFSMLAKNMVSLDEKHALQMMKLLDKLEEVDEVQHVSTNADFAEDVVEKYKAAVS